MTNQPVRPNDEGDWSEEITIDVGGLEDTVAVDHEGEDPTRCQPCQERGIKKMLDPRLPTQAEVDDHNLTHLPYRNWCP